MAPEKKRGVKYCSECETENGVRAYECKECDHPFKMKKSRRGIRRKEVLDFKTLKKGDVIRVVGGSGDYYEGRDGERQYFTDRGRYKVEGIDHQGIKAFGDHGYTYLYMGETCPSDLVSGVIKAPHKIQLLVGATERKQVR
jgi:hypothetical protein